MTSNGSAFLAPGDVQRTAAWRTPRPRRRVFPGHAAQVSHARRFVLRALKGWERADDAALLTSELATNAIRHTHSGEDGGTFAIVLILRRTAVIVAVTDQGAPTSPALRPTGILTPGGRGLSLVDALADRWGFHGNHDGRTVWFELDGALPSGRPGGE